MSDDFVPLFSPHTIRMPSRNRKTRKIRRRIRQFGGARGSVVGAFSSLANSWAMSVKQKFEEMKRDDMQDEAEGAASEKRLDNIANYAIPFSDEPNLEYSVGKNDLRNWGASMMQTLHYSGQRYTMREFFMNISRQSIEFSRITLPSYLELENAIRKTVDPSLPLVSEATIGQPELQPFYILAVMASANRSIAPVPIVFSDNLGGQ
jgi:hypothetical protein